MKILWHLGFEIFLEQVPHLLVSGVDFESHLYVSSRKAKGSFDMMVEKRPRNFGWLGMTPTNQMNLPIEFAFGTDLDAIKLQKVNRWVQLFLPKCF
jgi:hypothetical protein